MNANLFVATVLFCLFLLGLIYNHIIGKEERFLEAYVAFEVVAGVLITLFGFSLIAGWKYAVVALICFAASGLPMVAGSIQRNIQKAKESHARIVAQEESHD